MYVSAPVAKIEQTGGSFHSLCFRILDALFMTSPWKDASVVTTVCLVYVCSTFATGADTYTACMLFQFFWYSLLSLYNVRVVYVSAPVAKVEQTVVTTGASFHGEVIKRASRILKRKPTAHKKGKLTHFFASLLLSLDSKQYTYNLKVRSFYYIFWRCGTQGDLSKKNSTFTNPISQWKLLVLLNDRIA